MSNLCYRFSTNSIKLSKKLSLVLGHKETIDVLNVHAGVISSKSKVGSAKFYKLFAEFAELFEKSGGYDESYLDSEPTEVTHAYRAFRKCIKDEVTKVGGAERL